MGINNEENNCCATAQLPVSPDGAAGLPEASGASALKSLPASRAPHGILAAPREAKGMLQQPSIMLEMIEDNSEVEDLTEVFYAEPPENRTLESGKEPFAELHASILPLASLPERVESTPRLQAETAPFIVEAEAETEAGDVTDLLALAEKSVDIPNILDPEDGTDIISKFGDPSALAQACALAESACTEKATPTTAEPTVSCTAEDIGAPPVESSAEPHSNIDLIDNAEASIGTAQLESSVDLIGDSAFNYECPQDAPRLEVAGGQEADSCADQSTEKEQITPSDIGQPNEGLELEAQATVGIVETADGGAVQPAGVDLVEKAAQSNENTQATSEKLGETAEEVAECAGHPVSEEAIEGTELSSEEADRLTRSAEPAEVVADVDNGTKQAEGAEKVQPSPEIPEKRAKHEKREKRARQEEPEVPLAEPVLDVKELFNFELDRFQIQAINAIDRGESTIVCAPTGSGKTVVAEYAIRRALKRGKRCFYTTPLKALSNQKFSDLRAMYGEDKVGLLTGDISINRNAYIVVMTTEVYRNMLYGTVLGDLRSNLTYVEAVIVDECHYMNDPDRGTVWEELVIYSPAKVQLIALSATVANAKDLCAWMNKVHGPTSLVESSYRPVPLLIHYFVDGQIFKLMDKRGHVSSKLRRKVEEVQAEKLAARIFNGSSYDRRRQREKQEDAKRAIYDSAVRALDEKDMLPAIYFLFSRKRCDEAAELCANSVKLSPEHQIALNTAIDEAVREHPSLAGCSQLRYIRNGVASHHAGLLPVLKGLVENLFQQGLIKVVFATETLAAGINMPARTTVISAIVKNSDEGLRPMTASEFLQMSGRAGRRGMDEVGHVVVIHSDYENVNEVFTLAKAQADPLVSRFTPGYGMVLNLLQVHTREEARGLIERSFGQFVIEQNKGEYGSAYKSALDELKKNSTPRCTDQQIGDVHIWKGLRGQLDNLNRSIKVMKDNLEGCGEEFVRQFYQDVEQRDRIEEKLKAMRCNTCEHRMRCAKMYRSYVKAQSRLKELEELIERSRTSYWRQFVALEAVLASVGYIVDRRPNWEGEMAASLRATNILLLGEVVLSGILEDLQPAELAGVVSSLVMGDARVTMQVPLNPSVQAEWTVDAICAICTDLDRLQQNYGVNTPILINSTFVGLIEFWCRGTSWQAVREFLGEDGEGDLIKVMHRTLDLLRQFAVAPYVPARLVDLCHEAEKLLDRDEVHEAVMWTE